MTLRFGRTDNEKNYFACVSWFLKSSLFEFLSLPLARTLSLLSLLSLPASLVGYKKSMLSSYIAAFIKLLPCGICYMHINKFLMKFADVDEQVRTQDIDSEGGGGVKTEIFRYLLGGKEKFSQLEGEKRKFYGIHT